MIAGVRYCTWREIEPGLVTCAGCDRKWKYPPGKIPWNQHPRRCPGKRTTSHPELCTHLLGVTDRSIECGGCAAGVRSLWECKLHGDVLPWFHHEKVHSCQGCKDNTQYERIQ